MDRLAERLNDAARAQEALGELIGDARPRRSARDRDALLLRFLLAAEATWKAAQLYLRSVHGVEEGSPKGCVRASLQAALLGPQDADAAMELIDDRNLVVHTYREPLADQIAARIPRHARVLEHWLARMSPTRPGASSPPRDV